MAIHHLEDSDTADTGYFPTTEQEEEDLEELAEPWHKYDKKIVYTQAYSILYKSEKYSISDIVLSIKSVMAAALLSGWLMIFEIREMLRLKFLYQENSENTNIAYRTKFFKTSRIPLILSPI